MPFRLTDVPFSCAGSYLAFSYVLDSRQRSDDVMLRTVRGGVGRGGILRIVPGHAPGATHGATFTPELLSIPAGGEGGATTVEFLTPTTVRLAAGSSVTLHAENPTHYDTLVPLADNRFVYLHHSSETTLTLTVVTGHARVRASWDGVHVEELALCLDPGTVMEIEERLDEPAAAARDEVSIPRWAQWDAALPMVKETWAEGRELSAYVNWSSIVAPSGHLKRPSVLMSKNWMTRVWSWDNCFNALALGAFPELAWAQFRGIFDHQSRHGNLPDCIDDRMRSYSFVKPPVHGWTLDALWQQGVVTREQRLEILGPLERWTQWWLTERVAPGRRLPHYFHGNDSGWDNSTVFSSGVPVESPDLTAYLVLQCAVLARIAAEDGDDGRAARWAERADELLAALLEELWAGDRFIARHARTGAEIDTPSLLLLMPLVLGERLPRDVFALLVRRLEEGGFLTEHGLATEATTSQWYEPDGYWRGPIWAPSTYLVVDGLRRGGRPDLAGAVAERFCRMVTDSGAAENFDALTGSGNRDRAYTWTSSVFLLLAPTL
ncbi:amylo-alpha-1,6-glucosidase [Streptomyces sp. NPDC002920]